MDDPGVIALDPVRLHGLEAYLQGLADGCRRRAGRVADAVAGTGVGADHPIGELEGLAARWVGERDQVTWRRVLVEALDADLPFPARLFADPADEQAAAAALAERVEHAMEEGPPDWVRLSSLVAVLDRHRLSPEFGAAFLLALGGRRTRELPILLERAAMGSDVDPATVLATEEAFGAAVRGATHAEGDVALTEGWVNGYLDAPPPDDDAGPSAAATTIETALQTAGYGATVARWIATAAGRSGTALVMGTAGSVIGVVRAPLALDDHDGDHCDPPQAVTGAAGAVLSLVGVIGGPVALPATVAGMAMTGISAVLAACEGDPVPYDDDVPTYNPDTGETRLPSGSQSNPHVDAAGVPFPP